MYYMSSRVHAMRFSLLTILQRSEGAENVNKTLKVKIIEGEQPDVVEPIEELSGRRRLGSPLRGKKGVIQFSLACNGER